LLNTFGDDPSVGLSFEAADPIAHVSGGRGPFAIGFADVVAPVIWVSVENVEGHRPLILHSEEEMATTKKLNRDHVMHIGTQIMATQYAAPRDPGERDDNHRDHMWDHAVHVAMGFEPACDRAEQRLADEAKAEEEAKAAEAKADSDAKAEQKAEDKAAAVEAKAEAKAEAAEEKAEEKAEAKAAHAEAAHSAKK
jgi:cell division protein FtsN